MRPRHPCCINAILARNTKQVGSLDDLSHYKAYILHSTFQKKDLVPVSSTVIPLTVLEVSYGLGGKPTDEYKAAYLRKLRKQVQQRTEAKGRGTGEISEELPPAPSDADSLITGDYINPLHHSPV